MNDERTPEETRSRQIEIAHQVEDKGWTWWNEWVYMSPSGTCHDLSAADLTQIDRIEREGLFSTESKDFDR